MNDILDQIMLHDLRVELLISELLEHHENDILPINVSLKGQFERSYSKDVLRSTLKFDTIGDKYKVLEISREGIYDGLPAFTSHAITKKKRNKTKPGERSSLSDQLNEEEEYARNFFNPFEQEIYRLRGKIMKDEMELRVSLNTFNDYLIDLLEENSNFNLNYLVTMLPLINKLRGNIDDFKNLIEKLLEVDVTIKRKEKDDIVLDSKSEVMLGELSLGLNSVVGFTTTDFASGIIFNIKQEKRSYEQSKKIKAVIHFLAGLALSADVSFEIDVSVCESNFVLSNNVEHCPILAYDTIL